MRHRILVTLLVVSCGLAPAVLAEPVEVRQGDQIGAGYTFRRGATCTVVTVRHAVPYDAVDVRVTDRSGGTATGQRSYDNETYDLALVALPETSTVACTATWPDTGWIASTKFNSKSTFDVVRHTPDDRETILPVSYVGGTSNTITLAPVGKMKTQVTFSGSVVHADDNLLALVQKVDPATDRIEALRFDVIDRLVGSRFKSVRGAAPVHLSGVLDRGRASPNWTAYVNAWIREETGRVTADSSDPSARCQISVNVMEWARGRVPNPEYDQLQKQYDGCGIRGGIAGVVVLKSSPEYRAACQKQTRAKMTEVGRTLTSHTLTMEVSMKPRQGDNETKLDTVQFVMPSGLSRPRAEEELTVLKGTVGPMMTQLFETGVCD